jgi:hypothetical protein
MNIVVYNFIYDEWKKCYAVGKVLSVVYIYIYKMVIYLFFDLKILVD